MVSNVYQSSKVLAEHTEATNAAAEEHAEALKVNETEHVAAAAAANAAKIDAENTARSTTQLLDEVVTENEAAISALEAIHRETLKTKCAEPSHILPSSN